LLKKLKNLWLRLVNKNRERRVVLTPTEQQLKELMETYRKAMSYMKEVQEKAKKASS